MITTPRDLPPVYIRLEFLKPGHPAVQVRNIEIDGATWHTFGGESYCRGACQVLGGRLIRWSKLRRRPDEYLPAGDH